MRDRNDLLQEDHNCMYKVRLDPILVSDAIFEILNRQHTWTQ